MLEDHPSQSKGTQAALLGTRSLTRTQKKKHTITQHTPTKTKNAHHLLLGIREPGHLLPGHELRRPVGRFGANKSRRAVADRRNDATVCVNLLQHPLHGRVVGEIDARAVPAGVEHRGVAGGVDAGQLGGGGELALRGRVGVESTGVVRQVVVPLPRLFIMPSKGRRWINGRGCTVDKILLLSCAACSALYSAVPYLCTHPLNGGTHEGGVRNP